MEENR